VQELLSNGQELSTKLLSRIVIEVLKVAGKISTALRDVPIARHADATLSIMVLRYHTRTSLTAFQKRCAAESHQSAAPHSCATRIRASLLPLQAFAL
jgi:hypothetical protein